MKKWIGLALGLGVTGVLAFSAGKFTRDSFGSYMHTQAKQLQGRLNLTHNEANDAYRVITDAGDIGLYVGFLGGGVLGVLAGLAIKVSSENNSDDGLDNNQVLVEVRLLRSEVETLRFNQELASTPLNTPSDKASA